MSWSYVEAKAFELSVIEGESFLRLIERRRGFDSGVLLGKLSVA